MDYLSPIIGTVTGIEIADWREILIFGLKVFIFTVPFVILGVLVEKDIMKAPVVNRIIKSLIALLFCLPVFLFAVLNYAAPGMEDAFWERYPVLEGLWIMEGSWPPLILALLVLVYFTVYTLETFRGDLRD